MTSKEARDKATADAGGTLFFAGKFLVRNTQYYMTYKRVNGSRVVLYNGGSFGQAYARLHRSL